MLNDLRKQFNNPLLLALLALIAVAFVFTFGSWGGSNVSGGATVVARVNGHTVAQKDFSNIYRRQFSTGRYNAEKAKRDDLKAKVLDQLIDQELLAQEAERRGLIATDKELAEAIKGLVFGDEPYDKAEYHRQVRERFNMSSAAHFEEQMARDIRVQKLRDVIVDAQKVSPAELKEAYTEQNDKVDLHIIKIDPTYFKQKIADPTDDELKHWADKSESELKADYDKRITRYRKPKQVQARHVLIKLAKDASDDDKKAARAKIDAAKKRIDGGEDFATVAKDVSEEPGAKTSGGDLGLFGPGRMVKPFEEAAFAMSKGDVSDVVTTDFGYHVIKVEDIKEASVTEFNEVKMDIAKTLFKENKAMAEAKVLAKDAIAQLKSGTEPKALTLPEFRTGDEMLGEEKPNPYAPRLDASGPFARMSRFGMGGYIPRVGISEELVEASFKLTDAAPTPAEPFEVADRLYVVKLKERQKPDMAKFEETKTEIEKGMLQQRTYKAVEAFVKELRENAEIWKDPASMKYGS